MENIDILDKYFNTESAWADAWLGLITITNENIIQQYLIIIS